MGSFNEICTLSGMTICPGDKVRLLFLVQNPATTHDQVIVHRGNHPSEQWFLRTPPIEGKYDDYGRCAFETSVVTNIVEELFQKQAIEKPFGFNQYHACDVTRSKGLNHFLTAAWQGRLSVGDYGYHDEDVPEGFPTWKKVHALLRDNGFPIQSDSDVDSGCEGYNAQPISRGIVCVTFNAFSGELERLKEIEGLLSSYYDCRILAEREDDPCMIVTTEGSFKDSGVLFDKDRVVEQLTVSPKGAQLWNRQLGVLAVMVREDVWNAYCEIDIPQPSWKRKPKPTVEYNTELLQKRLVCIRQEPRKLYLFEGDYDRLIFADAPLQTGVLEHFDKAVEKGLTDSESELLIRAVAEASRIEYALQSLEQSWHIPSLGGQETNWELKKLMFDKLANICEAAIKQQDEEYDDEELEENEDVDADEEE